MTTQLLVSTDFHWPTSYDSNPSFVSLSWIWHTAPIQIEIHNIVLNVQTNDKDSWRGGSHSPMSEFWSFPQPSHKSSCTTLQQNAMITWWTGNVQVVSLAPHLHGLYMLTYNDYSSRILHYSIAHTQTPILLLHTTKRLMYLVPTNKAPHQPLIPFLLAPKNHMRWYHIPCPIILVN
jgi:hypothetical protein